MSAGVFADSKYECVLSGFIHPIRIQPETALASANSVANTAPTGALDTSQSAQVSASPRALGVHPRIVYAKISGTPPTGYSPTSRIRIPALTAAFFQECSKGVILTYLGTTWTITGRRNESLR